MEKTAICSKCGFVKVQKAGLYFRCRLAINQQKLARKHGVTVKDFGKITKRPEGCDICGEITSLNFDHDHNHKIFRGWLCRNCNLMLGYAKDNPETLRRAIEYLL